jgi:anti-anti-sigma regulatory factor
VTNAPPPREFDVQASSVGEAAVLAVRGEIDALTVQLRAVAINETLKAPPAAPAVNFSEVSSLDTAGMTVRNPCE